MKYKCENCGQEHEGWPAIAFNAPYYYLSDELIENVIELNEDFCVMEDEGQVDRFIRGVLIQKVNDHCEDLEYGVWVSLSEQSFEDYAQNFHVEEHEAAYFGWFYNRLPEYKDLFPLKTDVIVSKGTDRPHIFIQRSNDSGNPFVKDYFDGISKEEAQRRVDAVLNNQD